MTDPTPKSALDSMRAQIARRLDALSVAQAFCERYGPLMQPFEGGFVIDCATPMYCLTIFRHGADNDRKLFRMGELFGREGWTRKLNSDRKSFDWTKTAMGVTVTIFQAEPIDSPMDGSPVLPAAFPLMLEDATKSPNA